MQDQQKVIAVDVGNSLIKAARFVDREMVARGSVPQDSDDTSVRALLDSVGGDGLPAVVVGVSVDSQASGRVELASSGLGWPEPAWLSVSHQFPFEVAYETPETLGVDRLAAAAGAHFGYAAPGRPLVIVDAGTAVTIDVLDGGRFLGGLIAPGPELFRSAMASGTADLGDLLAQLPLVVPDSAIGSTSQTALRSGLMNGFVEMVDGLVGAVVREAGAEAIVVATGGWSHVLAEHASMITLVDATLVLGGLVHLYHETEFATA